MDAPATFIEPQSAERPGLSLRKVIVLGLVCAFAGFGLARFVDRPQYPSEGSVTVGFLRDMYDHHQQALEIAVAEATHGETPRIRQMAIDVMLGQRGEMALMAEHLGRWGLDLGDDDRTVMAWMGPEMAVPEAQMPGLATPAQLDALRASTGLETDKEFLTLMANHHTGGIHMATYASLHAGDRWTRAMASRMILEQEDEIDEMRTEAGKIGLTLKIPSVPVV